MWTDAHRVRGMPSLALRGFSWPSAAVRFGIVVGLPLAWRYPIRLRTLQARTDLLHRERSGAQRRGEHAPAGPRWLSAIGATLPAAPPRLARSACLRPGLVRPGGAGVARKADRVFQALDERDDTHRSARFGDGYLHAVASLPEFLL